MVVYPAYTDDITVLSLSPFLLYQLSHKLLDGAKCRSEYFCIEAAYKTRLPQTLLQLRKANPHTLRP